jgi:hypothetical protein
VQLLDILLQVVPEYVVLRGPSDHGDRILQGYLGLLNISGRQKDDQGVPFVSTRGPWLTMTSRCSATIWSGPLPRFQTTRPQFSQYFS